MWVSAPRKSAARKARSVYSAPPPVPWRRMGTRISGGTSPAAGSVSTAPSGTVSLPVARTRVQAVDVLRGLVIVLMAIDHTRDFVHAPAMAFPPEDLTQATAATFLTRWITHFCAPGFMLCAGIGAYLRLRRGTIAELSRFLWTRGLWLILLEFTIVRTGFFFRLIEAPFLLLVFWALGMSMIALAALIRLPRRVILAISVAMMAGHNLLDGVTPRQLGPAGWVWQVLHVQGLLSVSPLVIVAYPLIPWIGVMAAGFCLGRVYDLPTDHRRRLLMRLGVALTLGFVVVRALNGYGDPRPWAVQGEPLFTVLSFLNATKYPPSLAFLLMTLGPALLFLAWTDRLRVAERNPLLVFGRVPLFFFVVHIPVIHAAAIAMNAVRYGAAPFLFLPPPTLGTPRDAFPADYGWDLGVVYAVWIAVVASLYAVCLSYMRLKARRRDWWLSYL